MEENRENFWEKLAREVSGNATEEDKNWLKQNQDSASETVAQQAEKVWKGTALPAGNYEPDVEKGWQSFQMKVDVRTATQQPGIEKPAASVVRKMNMSTVYGIAASIALFI